MNGCAAFLRQCVNLSEGKRLHAHISMSGHYGNVLLENLLVQMYGRCGALEYALEVFSKMAQRNVFSWSIMMGAYLHNEQAADAVQLFHQMHLENAIPDKIAFLSTLSACSIQAALAQGKRMHACLTAWGMQSDVVVGTALVSMYAKCGSLDNARNLFDNLRDRNLISWNAIISASAQYGRREALQLFQQMQFECMIPNRATLIAVLDASGKDRDLAEGKRIHSSIVGSELESDTVVGTSLMHMYGKCASLENAWRIFKKLSNLNVVSWTAMIVAYSQHGKIKDVLQLCQQMDSEGTTPDKVTFIGVLDACANQAALIDGKRIHARIMGSIFESDLIVGNALVNMYGKCGSMEDARRMFSKMTKRDLTTWNSIITAHAQHGEGKGAYRLFQQMQLQGMVPSMVTFSSVLSACSRAGLVDEGLCCFIAMNKRHVFVPTSEHYNCLIDLLGRAGRLDEAENLINSLPSQHCATAWMTLLSSCRTHLDIDRGQRVAGCAFQLAHENYVPYLLLSNLCSAAGREKKLKIE